MAFCPINLQDIIKENNRVGRNILELSTTEICLQSLLLYYVCNRSLPRQYFSFNCHSPAKYHPEFVAIHLKASQDIGLQQASLSIEYS